MLKPDGKETAVVVVGGGPVGLALAIELSRLGVATTLVEARDGTINTPKMNFINLRSMEFVRRWGLTAEIRAAGHPEAFCPNILWVTAVTGHALARQDLPPFLERKSRFYSPSADCLCSQVWFDPILLKHARGQAGLTLLHRTELNGFRETDDGVEAEVTDLESGKKRTISAAYLVGCDGAQSTVREALGIGLDGRPSLQDNFHLFFNSDELIELYEERHGYARFTNLIGPGRAWGNMTSINWRGYWRFGMSPPPEDESQVADLLRRAVGRDFKFELLNSSHWVSRELVADSYRKGRIFIAGDAAHQNTTAGGYGMNTGLGDAMDLAWKLWGTLAGWGGPALLDSYEADRRPVAKRNTSAATRNLGSHRKIEPGDQIDADTAAGEAQRATYRQALLDSGWMQYHDEDGMSLGYRYDQSPIVCPDGTEAPEDLPTVYQPTARPGHRAPHAWLDGGPPAAPGELPSDDRPSTLDLFGKGFALLKFGRDTDSRALAEAAASRALPLSVHPIDSGEIAALYEKPLVLVRPDGHVAWRGGEPDDAAAIVDRVRGAG